MGVNELSNGRYNRRCRFTHWIPDGNANRLPGFSLFEKAKCRGRYPRALEELETASRSDENLMPHILRAVEAYATVGEISDVFRKVHGEFREAVTI